MTGRARGAAAVGALGAIVRGAMTGASEWELLGLVGRGVLACAGAREPEAVARVASPATKPAALPRKPRAKARAAVALVEVDGVWMTPVEARALKR